MCIISFPNTGQARISYKPLVSVIVLMALPFPPFTCPSSPPDCRFLHEVCGGAELLVLPEGADLDDPVDDGVHDHRRHQHDRQDDQYPHSELQLCKREMGEIILTVVSSHERKDRSGGLSDCLCRASGWLSRSSWSGKLQLAASLLRTRCTSLDTKRLCISHTNEDIVKSRISSCIRWGQKS